VTLASRIEEAVSYLRPQLTRTPEIALILGSGLGGLADLIELDVAFDYRAIPGFAVGGAPGHRARLLFGSIAGRNVACMQGRLHYYEGFTPEQIVFPLQVMQALGAETLLVTNAAGAINRDYQVGDLMLITDHINLTATSPLTFGVEQGLHDFVDMTKAYSPALRALATAVAGEQGLSLREGVYLGVRGPSFETPAEIRAFRTLGADAVGMSTVFEVLAARRLDMPVLGLSLMTNMAAGVLDQPITSEEVIACGLAAAEKMEKLMQAIISHLPAE
jgi:purine-nucleoside phosphorylase